MTNLSICIFGSRARGSSDALSDKDVLVVGDVDARMAQAERGWREGGWNVSSFSYDAFARLSEVGSLFVQHVKQEGVIVRDDARSLQIMLQHYKPKHNYHGERNDAINILASINPTRGIYWYDLCLADYCYVLFRNASILHLASQQKYYFEFSDIVDAMCLEFNVNPTERLQLMNLRNLKHGYRQRSLTEKVGKTVDCAREVGSYISNIVCREDVSSVKHGTTSLDYHNLRQEELRIIVDNDPVYLDQAPHTHSLYQTWCKIVGQGGYPKGRINLH